MKSYRGPLSYRAFVVGQVAVGDAFHRAATVQYRRIVAIHTSARSRQFVDGRRTRDAPGLSVGLVIQFNADLTQLKQNKWTVVLLGVISIAVFGFGLERYYGARMQANKAFERTVVQRGPRLTAAASRGGGL
jgi:hypothetical protein